MGNTKKKLERLKKTNIASDWEKIESTKSLSTREKLEKLVNRNLRTPTPAMKNDFIRNSHMAPFIVREFDYGVDEKFGKVCLVGWMKTGTDKLNLFFRNEGGEVPDPMNYLYFDTETTGLSGGTGTIPFMAGFGFFENDIFRVKIFILNNIDEESLFLDEIDKFISRHNFSATVTYNGKSFDFPLMETRYILNRKKFPLLDIPHLDFLPFARIIWKNTFESRRLGFLGDTLLGISREDDIDGSLIPALYFSYIRSGNSGLLENVIEHNSLDIVGLSALFLLAVNYCEDISLATDEGEILGVGHLFEKSGRLDIAEGIFHNLIGTGVREEINFKAVKKLAMLKKKRQLMKEAAELWEVISNSPDHQVIRELSIHYEHREKNFSHAIELVEKGLTVPTITQKQRTDLEKRLSRLKKKIEKMEVRDPTSSR